MISRIELGGWMSKRGHIFDHPVNSQTQLLDITPLEQPLHDTRVTREVLLDNVVEGDITRQTARRYDLHAIRELADLDAPSAQPIIPMAYRVDQRFAHGVLWVFQDVLAFQTCDDGADAHLLKDHMPGTL